jgi:ankyrin repeat protein
MRFLLAFFVLLSVACSYSAYAQEDTGADELRNSILLESVSNSDIDGIDRALDNNESIDTTNVNGWSAAHFAVSSGNFAMLEALVNRGIDLNIADETGYTALMMAASQVRVSTLLRVHVSSVCAANACSLICNLLQSNSFTVHSLPLSWH